MDCLWSAFIKNGREDDYRWTDAYLQSDLRAIVDVKSPDQDLNELNAGPGMAVRAGSKIEELLLSRADSRPTCISTPAGRLRWRRPPLSRAIPGP